MMSGKFPTKRQLKKMIKWHEKAIAFLPENDAMWGRMSRLIDNLKDRFESYDEFLVNPYKVHTSKPKYNSDSELELGDYDDRVTRDDN